MKPLFTIVVDTREQAPYEFSKPKRRELEDGGTVRYALDAGDYSAERDGELLRVRIERKTLGDFFGVVGRGRERFERELERILTSHYQAWLLIEATAEEIKRGTERSLVSGEAAFASALHWGVVYGIHPVFAGGRVLGQQIAQRILEESAVHF